MLPSGNRYQTYQISKKPVSTFNISCYVLGKVIIKFQNILLIDLKLASILRNSDKMASSLGDKYI